MLLKEWKINKSDESKPLIERLLFNRGITSPQERNDFLNPLEMTLTHPNAFSDMQKAVERILKAIENNENILIYGDFDADGLTSTSVMFKTLTYLGAKVSYYIPTRDSEGHGMKDETLVKLIVSKKPKLVITVDCGISNVKEVDFLRSFNIDTIITDHHEAPEELPNAYAIINPKAQNSLDERLSCTEIRYLSYLAGVGVSFKVACALLEKFDKLMYSYELLPFVAVGTVADVVPLLGENRYYVLKGLDLISQGKHYGFKRLLDNAGYSNIENGITAEQVAFGIAPRINASGRLDAVDDALKVLISENKQEVELSVISLENFNKIRQELCHSIFIEADEMAKNIKDNTIVLYKPDWHVGIIGIVASKIVEKYHKPAFLMIHSTEKNEIRCSARGVEGVDAINLRDIIANLSDKLSGFGGHALAAGLYFDATRISFDEVKKSLIQYVDDALAGEKIVPVINIDMELDIDDISVDTVTSLASIEPYGAGNPQPLFSISDLTVKEKKLMGSNKEHLKLVLEKDNKTFNAIWWSKGDVPLNKGDNVDIAFTPQLNTYNGITSVQLILKDIHSDKILNEETEPAIKIYDHRDKVGILKQVDEYLATTKIDTIVYAEDRNIIEQLKIYPNISARVKSRQNISRCDALMFFDYPPSEDIFNKILTTTKPRFIHYMNYVSKYSEQDFFKTMAGMVKFVCNNKQGKFSLTDSSSFLGVIPDVIISVLELFEHAGMVTIKQRSETEYIISLNKDTTTEKAYNKEFYGDICQQLNDIKDFKTSFKMADLDKITLMNI